MCDEEWDEHLQPLPGLVDDDQESDSSEDSDQLVIVSDTEDGENLLLCLNNYLNIDSADNTEVSVDEDHQQNIEEKSIDEDDDVQGGVFNNPSASMITSSSATSSVISGGDDLNLSPSSSKATSAPSSSKRKRRQWSIKEKLAALMVLEKNLGNKQLTANQCSCTRFQLSQWVKRKAELEALSKSTNGKKRKRLTGGGSKVKYVELDHRFLSWFREKRTFLDLQAVGTTGSTTTTTIRREKITFRRQLQPQSKLLSMELKHDCPSLKWFGRFMRRHRLSLQKPRNQKLPLSEVYPLVNKFYDHIRRSSEWLPSRGPMGAFLPRDVYNMDESPLSLFGDQSKLSINDINHFW